MRFYAKNLLNLTGLYLAGFIQDLCGLEFLNVSSIYNIEKTISAFKNYPDVEYVVPNNKLIDYIQTQTSSAPSSQSTTYRTYFVTTILVDWKFGRIGIPF